jgi:hypothetical protein
MEGQRQGRLSMPSRSGQKNRCSIDLNCRRVESKVSALHEAENGGDAPEALLSPNLIVTCRHFNHARNRIDTVPGRVVRPEMKDPIRPVEARRDGADGITESPFGEQCVLSRGDGLRCLRHFERLEATAASKEPESTSRTDLKAKTAPGNVVALEAEIYH